MIKVIKAVIKELERVSWFSGDVCINNIVQKTSDLVDENESLEERADENSSSSSYWEEEYNRVCSEISSLEDELSSLRNEIDDLKEQLSNKE